MSIGPALVMFLLVVVLLSTVVASLRQIHETLLDIRSDLRRRRDEDGEA